MTRRRPSLFVHDPEAVLDYQWDWTAWLGEDTISTHTIADDSDSLDIDSSLDTDTTVTAWISGGTVGTTARVTCHIVTGDGREDDRTITLLIRER